jgi:lysophospholipase L1-like esterase/mannose-6-phosphate isomerase-like protein (cupin superfamily)
MRLSTVVWIGMLAIAGAGPAVAEVAQRLVIAGDSTASSYPAARFPRTGWGQVLDEFLALPVENRAISGRSTRSYTDEGHLAALGDVLRPGDLLLIQFGHNDQKHDDPRRYAEPQRDFPDGLRRFLTLARERGARPVLITPVARREFAADGTALDLHGAWADAVRRVAREDAVPLIDLNAASRRWLTALGVDASMHYYLHDARIALADNTHFHRRGALAIACLVADALIAQQLVPANAARRDTDCGVPHDFAARRAAQRHPSLIAHADIGTVQQPGPHGGDGPTLASPLFADAPELGLVVRRRVLLPGASIGLHAHGKDEIYVILSGHAELTLDGQRHVVGAGHTILTRDGSSHSLRQLGSENLVVLIVYGKAPN